MRERKEDIPLLVNHFLQKHEANIGRKIASVTQEALEKLVNYNYPGNIRELENLIERFMIISPGNQLEIHDWYPDALSKTNKAVHFLTLEEMEIEHIRRALETSGGKVSGKGGAAEKLDINSKTLFSRMSKLGISKS